MQFGEHLGALLDPAGVEAGTGEFAREFSESAQASGTRQTGLVLLGFFDGLRGDFVGEGNSGFFGFTFVV
jgi:hypothetical protein